MWFFIYVYVYVLIRNYIISHIIFELADKMHTLILSFCRYSRTNSIQNLTVYRFYSTVSQLPENQIFNTVCSVLIGMDSSIKVAIITL